MRIPISVRFYFKVIENSQKDKVKIEEKKLNFT